MAEAATNSAKAGGEKEIEGKGDSGTSKQNIKEAFDLTQAYYCLDCGKCTSICPVALIDPDFSPRLIVKSALLGFEDDLILQKNLWQCLTCDLCGARCHSDVNIPEFIRRVRLESIKVGNEFMCSHNNVFNLISRLQLSTGEQQQRLDWVPEDIKYQESGETLFFVGCAPYHQIVFEERTQDNLALPKASLRLLNHVGIEPVLLRNERCCGHDAYWTGDEKTFGKLVELNVKTFKEAGVKKIVTACPEGHYMFSKIYPEYADDFPFECVHITELMADKISDGELKIPEDTEIEPNRIVSYHDSCKLGRFMEVYDAPRKIIKALPGVKFRELARTKSSSGCCGVSGFINCDMNSRAWRQAKLQEASDTGAETLLTGCPKCAIHLNCYLENEHVEPKFDITVEPVIITLAKALNLMPDQSDFTKV